MPSSDIFMLSEEAAITTVEVVVFDQDPVSRHALSTMLSGYEGIDVVAAVDDVTAFESGGSSVDAVAVVSATQDGAVDVVRFFSGAGLRVLCLGVDWTREPVAGMFEAGASGCLVKDVNVTRLAAAVRAVASGCVVLSDELRNLGSRGVELTDLPTLPASDLAGRTERKLSEQLLETLTQREFEVLELLARGWSTAEAAARLSVSKATVKSHVSHVLTKLGVRNRVEAVLLIRRLLDQQGVTSLLAS